MRLMDSLQRGESLVLPFYKGELEGVKLASGDLR